jgi:hypothetical protein
MITPSNQILASLSKNPIKSDNTLQYSGYHYGYHFSSSPLTIEHIGKIYSEIAAAKLHEISVSTEFPKNLDKTNPNDRFKLIQALIQTGISRISISQDLSFWDSNFTTNSTKFTRYFGKSYSKQDFNDQFMPSNLKTDST